MTERCLTKRKTATSACNCLYGEDVYKRQLPEGLEQMRFLHNRIPVKMIDVDYRNRKSMSGVDSPEDIERAEKIIAEFGEFNLSPE